MKTVANQKSVIITKTATKGKTFAQIEMDTLQKAAQDLKAGAFKLWVYLAKNQNGYELALSSKDAADSFGIKKDQYDTAVKELIAKGYLVNTKGNYYTFSETAVKVKTHNETQTESVVGKDYNEVVVKNHEELQEKTTTILQEKPTRNNTDNTNITNNNRLESPVGSIDNPVEKNKEWFRENFNALCEVNSTLFYSLVDGKRIYYKLVA